MKNAHRFLIEYYQYLERRADLRYLEAYIPKQFINMDVLGIAAFLYF
ncbi:MAG: hypothetical protein ACI9FB_002751 [Candidatus Azotimanducaceae bacterium]|jgi:hypothetical protein